MYFKLNHIQFYGFLSGSDGKESVCNSRDPGLTPDLGRSPGEGNGNPLQCSCLENPVDRGAWKATVNGVQRVRHDWATNTHIYRESFTVLCTVHTSLHHFHSLPIIHTHHRTYNYCIIQCDFKNFDMRLYYPCLAKCQGSWGHPVSISDFSAIFYDPVFLFLLLPLYRPYRELLIKQHYDSFDSLSPFPSLC